MALRHLKYVTHKYHTCASLYSNARVPGRFQSFAQVHQLMTWKCYVQTVQSCCEFADNSHKYTYQSVARSQSWVVILNDPLESSNFVGSASINMAQDARLLAGYYCLKWRLSGMAHYIYLSLDNTFLISTRRRALYN